MPGELQRESAVVFQLTKHVTVGFVKSLTNALALFFLACLLSFFPLFCPFSFSFLLLLIHQPGCLRGGTWTSLTSADNLSLRNNRNLLQFQPMPKHSRLSRKQLERDSKGTNSDFLTIRKCL